MRRTRTCLIALLLLSMSFYAGCKFLENSDKKVRAALATFDSGIKGNATDLESILTIDFTMSANPEIQGTVPSYNRSEFIEEIGEDPLPSEYVASISNVNVSGETASADMDLSMSEYGYTMTMVTDVNLRDEGDFFSSDWKVSMWYFDDVEEIVSGYSCSSSLRLHKFIK